MRHWNMKNNSERLEAIAFAAREAQKHVLTLTIEQLELELISMPVNRDDRFWNGGMRRAIEVLTSVKGLVDTPKPEDG